MRLFVSLSAAAFVLFAGPASADDWTGKSVRVKENGLKLGRKIGNGLVREGPALDASKTYTVKADDGSFLELDGGVIFKSDAELAPRKELPKEYKPLKEGEKVADGLWPFSTKVLPTQRTETISFGDRDAEGKQFYFEMSGTMPMEVRKDNGDGWVRIHDWHREGWVEKKYLVTKEDAPIYWDKAVKADPKDTFALYMRGNGWWQKREPDNAIADYNECIRLDPSDSAAYSARGNAWHDKKEYDKAIADHTEAIRLDPKLAIAYHNRGIAWGDKKDYDKAIADYTEAIRLDPKSANAFFGRSSAWHSKKDYDKAIEDYTEAIRLDPKYTTAFYGRGIARSNKKEYDKAITDYTEAIRLDPKYVSAFVGRGHAWGAKKEYDKAIEDYTEAIRLDPKYASAFSDRGWYQYLTKQYEKSLADFDQCLKLDPKQVNATGNRGLVFAAQKKYPQAVEAFEAALALKSLAYARYEYAEFLASCPDAKYRDGKRAVELAKKALEIAGKDAGWEIHAALAAAYAEADDFELAVTSQRTALDDKSCTGDDRKAQDARLELYRAKKPYRSE